MKTMGKIYPVVLLVIGLLFGSNANALVETRYVDVYNADPVAPYFTWATAANTMQDAINASGPGDYIMVADGTHLLSGEIVVNKAVTIQSVNGPGAAIVDGNQNGSCFNLGTSDCTISGFTIQNGSGRSSPYHYGGGVYCDGIFTPRVSNCVFRGNSATFGGGMYYGTANNCIFTNNTAGGGGMRRGNANNCIFIDNTSAGNYSAAGIDYGTASNCTFTGNSGSGIFRGTAISCTFTGNSAVYGGGIRDSTATNCTFTGNSASNGGGVSGGMAIDCTVTNNTATGGGGGMHQATVTNCIIAGNSANDGGGLYSCTAVGSTITNNLAVRSGGGMAGGTAIDCTISDNTTEGSGGGLYRPGPITSCIVADNTAGGVGGGIVGYWSVAVSNCTITGNSAGSSGGGIYTCEAINCTIAGNSAVGNGGGMHDGTATGCIITNNSTEASGGGMSYSTANNCIVSGNTAEDNGGGMTIGTANNCTISGNTADGNSGGIDYGTANNCTIIGNTAGGRGGGMHYYARANNCTIVGNSAAEGGGINHGTSKNCIIAGNTATVSGSNLVDATAYHSCSPDLTPGVNGNITDAPLFVDGVGGNYRLASSSPCINAGDNAYVSASTDLDGNPRIFDYVVDMGAYEYQSILDGDSDLMSDGYEVLYFGGRTNGIASGHADSDPHNNLEEYIAGTDPTDGASVFAVTDSGLYPAGFVVEWPSVSNRLYSVLWDSSLTNGFQTLETGIEFPQNSYTDTVNAADSEGFYQVDVQLKP